MAKTGDVMFTADSVEYNFMLAVDDNGRKRWQVQQLFTQPPSLIKNKIDMVAKAGGHIRLADGSTISTAMDIDDLLEDLRTLTDETDPTEIVLSGLDAETYNVLLDKAATSANSVVDETGRITEYEIAISCWDLFQST